MSMAAPGAGNPRPNHCPHCGSVSVAEVGIALVPGDAAIRFTYRCLKCEDTFLWPALDPSS